MEYVILLFKGIKICISLCSLLIKFVDEAFFILNGYILISGLKTGTKINHSTGA